MSRPLVAIKSCQKNTARRQAIRDTWLPSLDWADHLFIVGDPRPGARLPVLENDILWVPCSDKFENIAPKIRWFAAWALDSKHHQVFICDDDTYVCTSRLLFAEPNRHEYVGHMRTSGLFYNKGIPYAQGSAYWLGKLALQYVAEDLNGDMVEGVIDDGAVGRALIGRVDFVHDYRYEPGPLPFERYPVTGNDVITAHKCLPVDMRRMHKECEGL